MTDAAEKAARRIALKSAAQGIYSLVVQNVLHENGYDECIEKIVAKIDELARSSQETKGEGTR